MPHVAHDVQPAALQRARATHSESAAVQNNPASAGCNFSETLPAEALPSVERPGPSPVVMQPHDGPHVALEHSQGQDLQLLEAGCVGLVAEQPALLPKSSASAINNEGTIASAAAPVMGVQQATISSPPQAVHKEATEVAQALAAALVEVEAAAEAGTALQAVESKFTTAGEPHEMQALEQAAAVEMAALTDTPTAAAPHELHPVEEGAAALWAAAEASPAAAETAKSEATKAAAALTLEEPEEALGAPEAASASAVAPHDPEDLPAIGHAAIHDERQDSSDSWKESSSSSADESSPSATPPHSQVFPAASQDPPLLSGAGKSCSRQELPAMDASQGGLPVTTALPSIPDPARPAAPSSGMTRTSMANLEQSGADDDALRTFGMPDVASSTSTAAAGDSDGLEETGDGAEQFPAPGTSEDLLLPGMSDSPPSSPAAGRRSASWKRRSSSPVACTSLLAQACPELLHDSL